MNPTILVYKVHDLTSCYLNICYLNIQENIHLYCFNVKKKMIVMIFTFEHAPVNELI